MYAIVVYDVGEERVNKVKKLFRKYMVWIQNSVFEGELTSAQLMSIKHELGRIIDREYDAIHFYILKSDKYLRKETMGTPKAEVTNIL